MTKKLFSDIMISERVSFVR